MQLDEPKRAWSHIRMEMARIIAKRSLCSRDQVGAIITDTHNRVIGEGYNGPPAGFNHGDQLCVKWCPRACMLHWQEMPGATDLPEPAISFENHHSIPLGDYSDCPSLHAEANALMMSDRTARLDGSIYVTSFPCVSCLKLISNSGLKSIYIGVDGAHEYRYRESDYETVRRLGFGIAFEDGRQFEYILTTAYGWIDIDGTRISTENARNWCAPAQID